MTYFEVIQSLASRLLLHFDEIYHSAEIVVTDSNLKVPAIPQGDEWIDLSPTDQKETIYIRRNGDDQVDSELKIGSCVKSYKLRTPIRIVYFKDHAQNQDMILYKLLQAVLVQSTKLKSVTQDKWKLQREESSGNYNFGGTTAYFAIDVFAFWDLQPDNCEQDCIELDNPLKNS